MWLRTKAYEAAHANKTFSTASNVAIHWGLQVNANKVIFCMLLEIISKPDLLATIREEIAPFSKILPDGELKIDANGLVKSCLVFKATFFETMQLYTAGTSYKKVLQDVTLTESAEDAAIFGKPKPQTYHIAAGNYLVIPHETVQIDPRLWQNPTVLDARRFLVAGEKDPNDCG